MGVWVTEALGGISHSNGTAQEGAADGVSSKNRPADDRRPLWESTHHLQISVRSVSLTHVKVEPTLWGFSELREKKKKKVFTEHRDAILLLIFRQLQRKEKCTLWKMCRLGLVFIRSWVGWVVAAYRCDGGRGRPAHMTDKTGRR